MDGSLETLPIVIEVDSKKGWLAFLVALAAFVVAAWFSWQRYGSTFPPFDRDGYFYLALAILFLMACMLLASPELVLSPHGFTFRSRLREFTTPWTDFEEFSIDGFHGLTVIRFDYSVEHVGGSRGAFMGLWKMPDDQLLSLLNEARERWTVSVSAPSP